MAVATRTTSRGPLTRVRDAYNAFRHGPKVAVQRAQQRGARRFGAAPIGWPPFRVGQPQWAMTNYETYIREGFALNPLIYSAVMYKFRQTASAPLRAYTGDLDQPKIITDDNHPLVALCRRPNEDQSWSAFQGWAILFLNITGNSFTYLRRPTMNALPEAMIQLRPDRVCIKPGPDGQIMGYGYRLEGGTWEDVVPIVPEDMMHVKLPKLDDPLLGLGFGMSPIAPLAQSGDVDNIVTAYIRLFMEHGAMPPGVLHYEEQLSDEDIERNKERWRETYGGYENWTDVVILDQNGKYERVGLTFNELGFDALDQRNETRILGPFGVPLSLIATRLGSESSTYNNKELDRRAFWEDTFVPELGLFEDEFQHYLTMDGAFVKHDYSGVPALRKDVPRLVQAAYQMWQMGTPSETAYATVGLGVPAVEGGDVGFVTKNVQTIEQATKEPEPVPPGLQPFAGSGDDGEDDEPPEDESGGEEPQSEEETQARSITGEDLDEMDRKLAATTNMKQPPAIDFTEWLIEQEQRETEPHCMNGNRTHEHRTALLAVLEDERKAMVVESRTADWDKVWVKWALVLTDILPDVIAPFIPEVRLTFEAGVNQWSIDDVVKKVKEIYAHVPEPIAHPCPICGHDTVDFYADHGGLCVCQGCHKTFDPEITPEVRQYRYEFAEGSEPDWDALRQQDEAQRAASYQKTLTTVMGFLNNADGIAAIEAIPESEWDTAQAADEADAEAENESEAQAGDGPKEHLDGDWQNIVDGMTRVQKMVHLAARFDSVHEEQIRSDLLKDRRRVYEDELAVQARRVGCSGMGYVGEGAILSELNAMCVENAASIANTYNRELANRILSIAVETPRANRHTYAARIRAWETERDAWKGSQITQYTEGTARQLAQQAFYEQNGMNGEAELLPKEAKCPVCQGWIDRGMVPIREAQNNPPPYHVTCPHLWDTHPEQVEDCGDLWMGDVA